MLETRIGECGYELFRRYPSLTLNPPLSSQVHERAPNEASTTDKRGEKEPELLQKSKATFPLTQPFGITGKNKTNNRLLGGPTYQQVR